MTDTGQVSRQWERNKTWSQPDRCGQRKMGGKRQSYQSWRVTLLFHVVTEIPDLFLVIRCQLSSVCGLYSKCCLWTITHECTQAHGHTGEGDTASQLALARISRLKCTGGKGTPNTALTVRRQWLLINQSWQGLSGLLLDQTLMVKLGSCID